MDCSLPGSTVHGISQTRILEWLAISFTGDVPNPGIKPGSSALQADSLPAELLGKPLHYEGRDKNLHNLETISFHVLSNGYAETTQKAYVHWEHFIRTSGNPAPTRSHSRYPNFSPSHSCPCCSVTKSCPTVQPHDCSMPGLPVLHCLPELAQTHVHGVSGAIQPSHSLSPPYPFAFSLSQHQGLFQWVSSSHQVAKVLELQLQHQSFQWTFKVDSL